MATRKRLVTLGVSVVAALAALGGSSAQATFPGPDGRIAFADFNSGQIYAVNPNGSGLHQLSQTGKKHVADFPSWSPDGAHLLFSRYRAGDFGTNDSRIWIMNADGSGESQVASDRDGFRDYAPNYTPDASQIVFARCLPNDGVCAIWKMRADGTHKRALTPFVHSQHNEAVDFGPSISPNGKRVAFARFDSGGFVARIFLIGIDGSNPRPISPPGLEGFAPDWSPDGQRITFSSNGGRPGSSVFTMRADGTDVMRLTPSHFPHNDFNSAYSPAGDLIAFASDDNYPDFCCSDLFGMNANGSAQHLIDTGLSQPGVIGISWGTAPPTP
jgi:TolB protein